MSKDEDAQDYDENEYLDDKEFQARFLLSPDIPEEVKGQFSHLDKNLAITNLRHQRGSIDEPEQARAILKGLHVLNNSIYYKTVTKKFFHGYEEVEEDGVIVKKPVYVEAEVLVPRFPKTFHNIKSSFISFVNTSASRQGHRIRAATTRHQSKTETYEEKTAVQPRWGASKPLSQPR